MRIPPISATIDDPGRHYGKTYYGEYRGGAYERNDHWMTFFGGIADRIVREIRPGTTLDAGCAKGFLVEALRDRGVDASGVDLSAHAVGEAREDIGPYLRVGSLLEPLDARYDLITCIEVLEHLEPREAEQAVANLCAHTEDVLLSSTPDEFREATHVNVRRGDYWAELFARHGFVHDVEYDATYISPWSMRLRRARDPWPRQVAAYERRLHHLVEERRQRTELLLEQDEAIAERDRTISELSAEVERLRIDDAIRHVTELEAEVKRLGRELSQSEGVIVEAERQRQEREEHIEWLRRHHDNELRAYRESLTFRAAGGVQRSVRRVLPETTPRGRALTRGIRVTATLTRQGPLALLRHVRGRERVLPALAVTEVPLQERLDAEYRAWLKRHEPTRARLLEMRDDCETWGWRPLVSVLMPAYNSRTSWLEEACASLAAQAYSNWELVVVDDGSSSDAVWPALQRLAEPDGRIRPVRRASNGGIAAASQTALETAQGELVALMDHDDLLRPHALWSMVRHFADHPEDVVAHSDEDLLLVDRQRGHAYFKCDWSPDLLLSNNYACHLTVARRTAVLEAGGFRPGFDGSQDHDLLLRLSELGPVGHVSEVLYSWRQVEGSVALDFGSKSYAWDAGVRAVQEAVDRRGTPGTVEKGNLPGWYTVRYAIAGEPLVTVIIPTRDRVDLLRRCVGSVEAMTEWRNWRIIIVDNDSRDEATLEYLHRTPYTVLRDPQYFNYSRIMNFAARHSDGEHLLFLNNDVEVLTGAWMGAMLEHSQRPGVGGVGARLLFPDGRPQHEGILVGHGLLPRNLDTGGYANLGRSVRNVAAVTAAAMMMRREVFDEVGGFDERLRVAYNDVDLSLRIRRTGRVLVYEPRAELQHAESRSRGRIDPQADRALFCELWGSPEELPDPYVNVHIGNFAPVRLRD